MRDAPKVGVRRLLQREAEARKVALVLGDGEGGAGGGDGFRRGVGDELARRGDVLGNGLLGEDMLAGGEGGADKGRLGEDGQRDDDGGNVVAG